MNNPQHFGKRIRESLEQGLHVSPAVEARLRSARAMALDRQRQHEPAFAAVFAGRGMSGMGAGGGVPWLVRVGLPIAIILAAFKGFDVYRDHQDRLAADAEISQLAAEIEEIDAKVLTSDLPMKALLDDEFQAWLKKPAQPSQD